MLELIKEVYEYIYSIISSNPDFEIVLNKQNKSVLESFTQQIEQEYKGSIDENFIQAFILYQFLYYDDKKTRLGRGRVYLNWILGKKAIERWKNKNEYWFYFTEEYRKRLDIPIVVEKQVVDYEKVELHKQRERKRFLGTPQGFLHCHELVLFDKYSKECLSCKFKNNCK